MLFTGHRHAPMGYEQISQIIIAACKLSTDGFPDLIDQQYGWLNPYGTAGEIFRRPSKKNGCWCSGHCQPRKWRLIVFHADGFQHMCHYGMEAWREMEMYSKILNPLRAKLFRGNINVYLHFMSLLHIDMTQVLKILPQVTPGLTYFT